MSPLEQFEILPIFNFFFLIITNSTIILIFLSSFIYFYINMFKTGTIVPSRYQSIFEGIYIAINELVYLNIGKVGCFFFPLIFSIFLFILLSNFIGMIPYSFTITSHLIVTFSLALMLYIGFNFMGIKKHKLNFFSLLLPSGASLTLVPLLVPIELVSYIFRVISLPVRLFANMMAGHTLLKVIAGFAWSMVNIGSIIMILAHFIPLILLVILIGLEFCVAAIQAYVFTILTCMYINDALNLH